MARYAVKDAAINMESKGKAQTEAETKANLNATSQNLAGQNPAGQNPAGQNPAAKSRKCLMCSTAFPSDWSGERICRKCKSSSTWRSA